MGVRSSPRQMAELRAYYGALAEKYLPPKLRF